MVLKNRKKLNNCITIPTLKVSYKIQIKQISIKIKICNLQNPLIITVGL